MGNTTSQDIEIRSNPDRIIFISFKHMIAGNSEGLFNNYMVFVYTVRYMRYQWDLDFRFNELDSLDMELTSKFYEELKNVQRPEKYRLRTKTPELMKRRALCICKYLQEICDKKNIFIYPGLRRFLHINPCSFNADMGRKGREGWLKKSSGGFVEKFSRKIGDYVDIWSYRWIVMYDSCIAWYKTPISQDLLGSLQIDPTIQVTNKGRIISIVTQTRKLLLYADTPRLALNWVDALNSFYQNSSRLKFHFFESSFSPRKQCEVSVYTITKEYMSALAISLLSAQKEILITNWKNSPTLIMSRPPYPAIRLDQILKYKAEQGVKVYLLLYKEVEGIGQTNDSGAAKTYLESLSHNIRVIRHPNKFMGGSTAVLWSHHEKSVVIDRSVCYLGGVDLAFTRWDDDLKRLSDEDGLVYPGHDYRNPAPGLFKPLRTAPQDSSSLKDDDDDDDSDNEMMMAEVSSYNDTLSDRSSLMMFDNEDSMEMDMPFDIALSNQPTSNSSSSSTTARRSTSSPKLHRLLNEYSTPPLTPSHYADGRPPPSPNPSPSTRSSSLEAEALSPSEHAYGLRQPTHEDGHGSGQQLGHDDEDAAYNAEKNRPETAEERQVEKRSIDR